MSSRGPPRIWAASFPGSRADATIGTIEPQGGEFRIECLDCADRGVADELLGLQRALFVVGADLATNPGERARLEPGVSLVADDMVGRLEARIDEIVAEHPLPNAFVVPGANHVSAALDVARGVVRRAERRVVELRDGGAEVNDAAVRFLNRLSDLLFVLARWQAGESEPASR